MSLLWPLTAAGMTAATVGGKALMLSRLQQAGFRVPEGYVLPTGVYRDFLHETGLEAFIAMELQRKDFAAMRWEEIWDVSLRIRNHFTTCEWPAKLRLVLLAELQQAAESWDAAAVRSTAPGEDAGEQSFAGLHESRVMLRGVEQILDAIPIVWASLWSDAALLYRQELGLDPGKSSMAVLVQEMVIGEVSGILFTRAPQDRNVMMAEAVWGLNQALVDGTIEPDRWQFSRATGAVLDRHEVRHTDALRPESGGVKLCPLENTPCDRSPFDDKLAAGLYQTGLALEASFGDALDIEWTSSGQSLTILQVRPITAALQSAPDDERPWYLSLHRSLGNLEALQAEIEGEILPGMERDAEEMNRVVLQKLTNQQLAAEHRRRIEVQRHWLEVYRDKCIPMAHGIRLFGEYYNDQLKPDDPYAFLELLHSDDLLAVQRNRRLQQLAVAVSLADGLTKERLRELLEEFTTEFGGINWILRDEQELLAWLKKLADQKGPAATPPAGRTETAEQFIASLAETEQDLAKRLLAIARASYLLRDNDNLYLGKITAGHTATEQEIAGRLREGRGEELSDLPLKGDHDETLFTRYSGADSPGTREQPCQVARQLVGQPAGPGVSSGPARVLCDRASLKEFSAGEVLVCDAIEPNMTFLTPLAAAIVERRGGMLVHGAIIAREYGIPCVTGIHDATRLIETGDMLTVDGFLGIVTVDRDYE